jgi:hypothetical protein
MSKKRFCTVLGLGLLAILVSLTLGAGCQSQSISESKSLPSNTYVNHPPQYIPAPPTQASTNLGGPVGSAPVTSTTVPPSSQLPIAAAPGTGSSKTTAGTPDVPASPQQGFGTVNGPSSFNTRSDANNSDKAAQVKLANLDDFALKSGGLVVNNFCLTEEPDEACKGQAVVKLCACYRSRTPEQQGFSVMAVGLDETGDMLWACNLAGTAEPGKVGVIPEITLVAPTGTLKRTVTIWLRVNSVKMPRAGSGPATARTSC